MNPIRIILGQGTRLKKQSGVTLPSPRLTNHQSGMQRIGTLFDAKFATIDFSMQRILCIFDAKFAANEHFHTSIG